MQTMSPLAAGNMLYALERYSFSDEAARHIAAHVDGLRVANVDGIAGVFAGIKQGNFGLIPVENASGGLVNPHIALIVKNTVRIIADIHHKIRMCAGGRKGGKHVAPVTYHSHMKGLEQCRNLINGAQEKPYTSTVQAARSVGMMRPGNVALASQSALEDAKLEIYATDVADMCGDENITQMYVGKQDDGPIVPESTARYHALMLTPKNMRGVIARITGMITNARMNLSHIHSINRGHKRYTFFIEMEREGKARQLALLAEQLLIDQHITSMHWLGSWDDRYEN